jgi:hypothetical protein
VDHFGKNACADGHCRTPGLYNLLFVVRCPQICAVILKMCAVILNEVKDLCTCAINSIGPSLCSG